MKTVIVTGILGQDGANMAEFLLKTTEHRIIGVMRRSANPNYKNIESIRKHERFGLDFLELSDTSSIDHAIKKYNPDYFINFAANSFVGISWEMPESVFDVNALGVLRCLEAIRKFAPDCRFYSAGSSEEFGDVDYCPQDIRHPIKPRSPYGASKAAGRHITKVYRESYNLYAVHGILFNHEGPKRGEEFVTKKITSGVARILNEIKNNQPVTPIELGNLDSKRDWSDSRDFVKGVWMMLNQENFNPNLKSELEDAEFHYIHDGQNAKSESWRVSFLSQRIKDYILSSGETHTIREFVERAFNSVGIKGTWINGQAYKEKYNPQKDVFAQAKENGAYPILVQVNSKFYRPAEVDILMGDSTPIRQELGWKPEISLDQMIKDMIQADLKSK
jgi:GDPmannose 4,6-dehydratase